MLALLSELKTLTGVSDDDATLTACIVRAQAEIERYCRRTIEYVDADIVETFSGDGESESLGLKAWPVIAGSYSVKLASDGDFAAAAAETERTGYWMDAARGVVTRLPLGQPWPRGVGNIQVTYRGGYLDPAAAPIAGVSPPPRHIQEAVLLQASHTYNRRKDPAASSASLPGGGGSLTLQGDYRLLPSVMDLLTGERRMT